jgi:membrane-bound metal-dependent hydrolase YbcI (DUF457 family)
VYFNPLAAFRQAQPPQSIESFPKTLANHNLVRITTTHLKITLIFLLLINWRRFGKLNHRKVLKAFPISLANHNLVRITTSPKNHPLLLPSYPNLCQ